MRSLRDDEPVHFLVGGISFNDAKADERHPVIRHGPRPPVAADLRRQVVQRDRFTCQLCLQREGILEVDHILPWSAGGEHESTNLRTLCQTCNQQRSNFRYPGNPQPLPIIDCNRCTAQPDARHTIRTWCPLCRGIGTANPAQTNKNLSSRKADVREIKAFASDCPICEASAGQPCRRAGADNNGRTVPMRHPHPSRREATQVETN